jgi:hypothetical protein
VNIEITDIAAEEIKNAFKDNEITEPFIVLI